MQAAGGQLGQALRTPRAAGVAGILSALLLGTVIVLIHITIPVDPASATGWLADSSHQDTLRVALDLLPFTGILFLWFIGAVRDYVGRAEDKFFATLFLGSGILFTGVLFVLAAAVGGLLATFEASPANSAQPQLWQWGHHFALTLLASYGARMAAVFTLSTTTIGRGLGIFPRWLTWLGYLIALVLLFASGRDLWVELAFPVWVLAVSGYVLVTALRPGTALRRSRRGDLRRRDRRPPP